MAPGTKRQASQAPRAASKKIKVAKSKTSVDEDAASSSDRDGMKAGDEDEIVVDEADLLISKDSKTEDWVTSFREIIDKKEKEILKHLEMRKAAINNEAATLQSQMLPIFAQALLPIDADETPRSFQTKEALEIETDESSINVAFPNIEQQEVYDNIRALTTRSKTLAEIYRNLKSLDESTPETSRFDTLQAVFAKDRERTKATLAAGKNVALTDVQGMLADRYHEVRGRSGLNRDEEASGRTVLAKAKGSGEEGDKGRNTDEERDGEDVLMGWGNVAVDMQKAVKRLDDVVGHE